MSKYLNMKISMNKKKKTIDFFKMLYYINVNTVPNFERCESKFSSAFGIRIFRFSFACTRQFIVTDKS